MIGTGSEAAMQAYTQIGSRSDVETANPHRLIQLMMERVITKIAMARGHMDRGSVAEKGRNVGDAIDIITVLQASLNDKPNRKLARNFDALYDYMTRRLVEANFRDDVVLLDEVSGLMRELKDAWDAIGEQAANMAETDSV